MKELPPVARQQRLLMTHGTGDPLMPIDQVRPQIPLLKAAGINVEWREFAKVHTMIEEEIVLIRDFVSAGYEKGLVRLMDEWIDGKNHFQSNNPIIQLLSRGGRRESRFVPGAACRQNPNPWRGLRCFASG